MSLIPSREKIILYIQPHGFDMVFLKNQDTIHLDFPLTSVNNLEIIDQIAFETQIDSFFSEHPLKGVETIMLLSEKTVFSKEFAKTDIEKTPSLLQDFFDKIPFSSDHIQKDSVSIKDTVYAYAVYKPLYETILSIAKKHGMTVTSVVPAPVFPELNNKEVISREEFLEFSKNNHIRFFNLHSSGTSQSSPSSLKKNVLSFVGVIIVASCVFLLLSRIQKPKDVPKQVVSPTAAPSPTQEPVFKKTDYSITILNGSGIAGQAGAVKEMLEKDGYTIVSTGNADVDTYKKTIISVHESVPKNFIKTLKTSLLVEYAVSDNTDTFTEKKESDVIIYTGSEKNIISSSP